MHEIHLLKDLLKKVESIAAENHASKVSEVRIKLGALSHISPEHLKEHFLRESEGGIAEGAKLVVIEDTDQNSPQAMDILLDSIEVAD